MWHDKLCEFSVYELSKLRQYVILCCASGNYNIVFICHFYSFMDTHTHTHTHRDTHTDIHTHIHTHMQNSSFFNENIRSNKKMKIERNKLKYLHYLNKMIEKCKMKKFIFSEVSSFYPESFHRFCLDFKWLHLSFRIQWTPFKILLIRKQPLEILVKSWKISYEEFHS